MNAVMRLFALGGLSAPERPWKQPRYRIDENHRGYLSPGKHVVAYGNLISDEVLDHPLVNALVTSAYQDHMFEPRQLLSHSLVKQPALRRKQDHARLILSARYSLHGAK